MEQFIHYFLHLIFPGILSYFLFRENWIRCYAILLLTMLVDLDHLLATPIFDPCRCSINFTPCIAGLLLLFTLSCCFQTDTGCCRGVAFTYGYRWFGLFS
jgi:hypothetical protein